MLGGGGGGGARAGEEAEGSGKLVILTNDNS